MRHHGDEITLLLAHALLLVERYPQLLLKRLPTAEFLVQHLHQRLQARVRQAHELGRLAL